MDKAKTIIGCGLENGKNRGKIQRSSGIPERTFESRMADPDKLTLGELRQIVVATCMPDETALRMVKEVHRRTK